MDQKKFQQSKFQDQWDLLQIKPLLKIFKHKFNGQHCEEYLINVATQRQKQIFLKRKNQVNQNIVSIFHCQFYECSDSYSQFKSCLAKIYIEKITIKLNEIIQLPGNAVSQFIEQTLIGFKTLCRLYQPVRVTSDMIGFNQFNKTKVWLSNNFLQNWKNINQAISQEIMVNDIFKIFDRFTINYDDRTNFMNFNQALQYLEYKKLIIFSKFNQNSLKQTDKYYSDNINRSTRLQNSNNLTNIHTHIRRKTLQTNQIFNQVCPSTTTSIPNQNVTSQIFKKSTPAKILKFSIEIPQDQYLQQKIFNIQINRDINLTKCVSQNGLPIINLESARTTSKNIELQNNLIQLDKNQFQLFLIDEKKTKEIKLHMIQNILENQNSDKNIIKICKIYRHALKYDPLMYHELQKVQGRISKISNNHILKKLIQLSESNECDKTMTSNIMYTSGDFSKGYSQKRVQKKGRDDKINKILQQEKKKRNKEKKSIINQIKRKQSIETIDQCTKNLQSFVENQNNKRHATLNSIMISSNLTQTNKKKSNFTSQRNLYIPQKKIKQQNTKRIIQYPPCSIQDLCKNETLSSKILEDPKKKQKMKKLNEFKSEFQKLLFE